MDIEGISAVPLAVHDMARAVAFYRALGFDLNSGGENAAFIFHVADVDADYEKALTVGLLRRA